MTGENKNSRSLFKRVISAIIVLCMVCALVIPSMTLVLSAAVNTSLNIDTAGGTNYSLFNSGATASSGYDADYGNGTNPAPDTHNNNGYDLYGEVRGSAIRLGLAFTVNIDITEQSQLSIKAWDVDESYADCGYGYEYDYIYLVDETSGTSVKLDTHLSGQNNKWNTSVINIPANLLKKGHTYHFELRMTCTGNHSCSYYCVTVRTVDLIVNGNGNGNGPVVPNTGIESADLVASISSSGNLSVSLNAKAYSNDTYILEYKAV